MSQFTHRANYTARQIEQAKLCQLLTGSYATKIRTCPCVLKMDCVFSPTDRDDLESLNCIKQRADDNAEEYRKYVTSGLKPCEESE